MSMTGGERSEWLHCLKQVLTLKSCTLVEDVEHLDDLIVRDQHLRNVDWPLSLSVYHGFMEENWF